MELNYVKVLEESLHKKTKILSEIILKNKEQKTILKAEKFIMFEFDKLIDEKELLIQQLLQLDNGFRIIYDKIKSELEENKKNYKQEIARMQVLIQEITDKSISIQTEEVRNRVLVEAIFQQERVNVGRNRTTSKVALNYYKSMNRSSAIPPQFMDQKK